MDLNEQYIFNEDAVGNYAIKARFTMQHFLLSLPSRTLSLKQIFRLSDDGAFRLMKGMRWGNPDNLNDVCCPHCNKRHNAYFLEARKRWCCKHCKRHFYITTNTAFAFHKLPLIFWRQSCFLQMKSKAFPLSQ